MGYSSRAHTWFGWKLPSRPYMEWAERIDWDFPKGVMTIGVDSEEIIFGVELFRSSDNRWDPLSGSESWTAEEAKVQLETWMSELSEPMKDLVFPILTQTDDPKFHTFINTT
jgi:hypothetical protein